MRIATKVGDGGKARVDSRLRDDKHAGARWSKAW